MSTSTRDRETRETSPRDAGSRLRRVGSLWKPRPGSRSKGSGVLTIGTLRQRFLILPNERKTRAGQPDYVLMSSEEPEVDEYARDHQPPAQPASQPAPAESGVHDDDIPF